MFRPIDRLTVLALLVKKCANKEDAGLDPWVRTPPGAWVSKIAQSLLRDGYLRRRPRSSSGYFYVTSRGRQVVAGVLRMEELGRLPCEYRAIVEKYRAVRRNELPRGKLETATMPGSGQPSHRSEPPRPRYYKRSAVPISEAA